MLLQGVGVSPGVGIGRAVVIAEGSLDYTQVHFAGVQQEKARLRTAVQAFAQRTQAMADALRARLDGQEADILASQILMANDPALLAQTDSRIEAGECAEAALDAVCASYIQLFAAAGDELLAQRAADIEDIRARLLAILLGRSEASIPDVPPGTVLIAWDLTPSMTVSVNRENVAAFVAECGGMTSHAAILARALGLPPYWEPRGRVCAAERGGCRRGRRAGRGDRISKRGGAGAVPKNRRRRKTGGALQAPRGRR
ncbi:MAG: phosphoenolpyruvate-utilizing N-terminal domain-containing protein [Ruthenibacterium lactatiformans]